MKLVPLTLERAKNLTHRDMLYHRIYKNADGSHERWRVNGMVKRWKREPDRIRVPIKHGLYNYWYVYHDTLEFWLIGEETTDA